MRLSRWLVGSLASLLVGPLLAAPATAGCKKSLTLRETPGGDAEPAQLVECDESEAPVLLEQNAQLRLCDPKALALAGVAFEDCARAVAAAREGLRQAKLRAALRAGEDEEALATRYGASEQEIEALRTSVEFSGPMPESSGVGEEPAQ